LAVEFGHDPNKPMHRRMSGADVEKHIPRLKIPFVVLMCEVRRLDWHNLVDRPNERLPLFDRIVLAQRMTFKPFVHENALQIRMSTKADPEHVPDLALEPVG